MASVKQSVSVKERLCLASVFFTLGAVFASWAGRIPELKANLGLSDAQLGMSMFCLAIGSLISMPISGALGVRFGTKRLTIVFACGFAMSLILIGMAPTWMLFSLALFCFGFMMGGQDVSMNAHAVHVERDHGRSIMSSFHGAFSLGAMSGGAFSAAMCSAAISPRMHFVVIATLLVPSMLVVGKVLLPRNAEPSEEIGPIFVLPDRRLIALAAVAFCSFIGEGAISDWSAVYLERDLKSGPTVAASGFAIFSLSMAICRFCGDGIVERLGQKWILVWGGLIASSGIAVSLLVPIPIYVLAAYLVVGMGFSCMVPVAFSSAGRNQFVPPSMAIAGVATAGYFGFIIAPPIIGFMADWMTLRVALWLTVVLSLAVSAIAPFAIKQAAKTVD
jgi:MFS family permease